MNEVKNDFVYFDFRSFAKTLSQRDDISADIARKYLSEIEEYNGQFPSDEFEQSIGVIFEAIHNEKNKSRAPGDRSLSPLIDDAYGKQEIWNAAQILSRTPGIQSQYFINTALKTVLDTELYPLYRELNDPDSFNSLLIKNGHRGFISGVISVMIPKGSIWTSVILKAILYLVLIAIAIISFISGNYWISLLAAGFYAYFKFKRWKLKKFVKHLATCYGGLKQIRDEIEMGAYNSTRIAEKLKELEKNGVYVPSIAYSLLDCTDQIPLK